MDYTELSSRNDRRAVLGAEHTLGPAVDGLKRNGADGRYRYKRSTAAAAAAAVGGRRRAWNSSSPGARASIIQGPELGRRLKGSPKRARLGLWLRAGRGSGQ